MTDLPDVKLRALTNFPVAVTGRTGINVVKINGRWYIDYDVSGIVQNSNIPADQVDQYWFTVWNEVTNSYVNVPFSLAATSGVASLDGHTGALDIGDGLKFTGDTLEVDLGDGMPAFFETKAAAVAYPTPAIVPYLFTDGRISAGKGRGWWTPVAGNVAPAHGEYILTNARYFEPSFDDGGAIFLSQFGMAPWEVTNDDMNAPLQRSFAFGAEKNIHSYILGGGDYRLLTKLPQLSQPVRLFGANGPGGFNLRASAISRWYDEPNPADGVFHFVGTAACLLDSISIIADNNSNGGSPVVFYSTAEVAGGFNTIRGCYISADAGSSWNIGPGFFGGLHVSGSRSNFIESTQIFGATTASLYLQSCIHFVHRGGGLFLAGGSGHNLIITGGDGDGSTTITPSSEAVSIVAEDLGAISLDHCRNVRISSTAIQGNITNSATVFDTWIDGPFSRFGGPFTCENNWDKPTCFRNGSNITEVNATDGYAYYQDGTITQWAQFAVTGSAASYSFPIPFPNKCTSCRVSTKGATGADHITIASGGFTTSVVSLVGSGAGLTAIVEATGR